MHQQPCTQRCCYHSCKDCHHGETSATHHICYLLAVSGVFMISLLLSGFAHAEWSTQGAFGSAACARNLPDDSEPPAESSSRGSLESASLPQTGSRIAPWNIGLEVANGILWGDMTDVGYSVDAPFRPIRSDNSSSSGRRPATFATRALLVWCG